MRFLPEAALGAVAGRLRRLGRGGAPTAPARILLIACHWVGDSLWATQVLAPLAARYGREALWVAAPARTTSLWAAHLPAGRVLTLEHVISDRQREAWSPWGLLEELVDARRLGFEAVLDLTGNRYSALFAASLGAWCCGPATHPWAGLYDVATPCPPEHAGAPAHLALRPFRAALPLLRALPEVLAPAPPPFPPDLGRRVRARLGVPDGPLAVLVPGAGWISKRWPVERFAELARRLGQQGHAVVALGSPAERTLLAQAVAPHGRACSSLDLLESTALCAEAAVVVSNDNGLAHLAASTGARVVALFGPTNPARYRPLGPRVTVLRHACPQRPEGVHEHCLDHPARPCPVSCWASLDADTVWTVVDPRRA